MTTNDKEEELKSNNIYEKYSKTINFDFYKIKQLHDETKDIKLDQTKINFEKFKGESYQRFFEKIKTMKNRFDNQLNESSDKMKLKIEEMSKESESLNNQKDISNYEIPTENITIEDIRNKFEKIIQRTNFPDKYFSEHKEEDQNAANSKSLNQRAVEDIQSVVDTIKKFSDNERIKSTYKHMENIIYWKYLNDRLEITKTSVNEKQDYLIKFIKEEYSDIKSSFFKEKISRNYILPTNTYFNSDPTKLKKETLIADTCQKAYTIDSVFCAFVTNDKNSYISWTNTANTVDVYSLNKSKITQQMKGHSQHIYIVRHFYNKKTNQDFLLSTSYDKKAIVWKYDNSKQEFSAFLSINTLHSGLYLYSGLILFDYNSEKPFVDSSFVVTSVPHEQHKVFNLKGTMLRNIGNKADYTYFINSYFDSKKNAFYIINANSQDVKILDFKDGSTVKIFKDDSSTWHMSAFINDIDNVTYLFETDGNGNLRIWDFEKITIHKKVSCSGCSLRGIIQWNEKYIVAASSDKSFKVINLDSNTLEHSQVVHDNVLCSVQKILHPKLGECLITCAIDGKLKIYSA